MPLPRPAPFAVWFVAAAAVLAALGAALLTAEFAARNLHYPLVMVLGAFVAGATPQGGGAVAFPALSVFLEVDRVLARDFALMVQSVGMTSASVYVLTRRRPDGERLDWRPLAWWLPLAALGFVAGMATLQDLEVTVVQGLFVGLMTAFAVGYWRADHRGRGLSPRCRRPRDALAVAATLFAGGLASSLFGTGADVLLFTLLVTWFAMREREATELSIVVMAALSVLGFLWRGAVQQALTADQVRAWLLAAPVVLVMAPLGAFVLARVGVEWLLRAVVLLNVLQLAWFNLAAPSPGRSAWSLGSAALAYAGFGLALRLRRLRGQGTAPPDALVT